MHIIVSGDWDDLMAQQAALEEAANARITPSQARVRDDLDTTHYFALAEAGSDEVQYGVVTPAMLDDRDGADELRQRGYVSALLRSQYDYDDGEVRDVHVSVIVPIPRALFDLALAAGFPSLGNIPTDLLRGLQRCEQRIRHEFRAQSGQ